MIRTDIEYVTQEIKDKANYPECDAVAQHILSLDARIKILEHELKHSNESIKSLLKLQEGFLKLHELSR